MSRNTGYNYLHLLDALLYPRLVWDHVRESRIPLRDAKEAVLTKLKTGW